jgi:putative inorganic carbon (HCO3(-)) transporter
LSVQDPIHCTMRLKESIRRILSLEWLVAGAAAPFLMFPTVRPRWTATALAVLVVWWLLRWAVRGEPWPVTPFNGALLLFALMVPVGIWASPAREATLPDAVRVVLGLITFRAVTMAVNERHKFAPAVGVFCLIGLVLIGVGLLGAQWSAKMPILGKLSGRIPHLITTVPEDQGTPGVNPNHLAGALTLYLPLSLALVFSWRFSRRAMIGPLFGLVGSLLFFALVVGTLLLTQSRSGWMGGAAGVLALVSLAGLTSRRRWARGLGGSLPVLAMLAVGALVLRLGPQQLGESLFGKESASPVEEVVGAITLEDRVEIWSRALYAIQDFPFTGCGLGAFRRVVPVLYPLFTVPPDTDIGHAHNIFLQTALDLGIPGLVAYLALLGIALAVCWQVAVKGDRWERAIALGLAGSLIALHAYGMTDALALGSKPAVAFWFALGLIAALIRSGRGGWDGRAAGA